MVVELLLLLLPVLVLTPPLRSVMTWQADRPIARCTIPVSSQVCPFDPARVYGGLNVGMWVEVNIATNARGTYRHIRNPEPHLLILQILTSHYWMPGLRHVEQAASYTFIICIL